jgi:DMSO reductase anchor subunit
MRVLNHGEMTTENGIALWNVRSETHPFPLPGFSRTQPRLAIKPHPAMSTTEKKYVANMEEIQPRVPSGWEDVPLILFTLLAQIAVGGFWAMSWMFPHLWTLVPILLIGVCLGTGMVASFAHLGTKKNARYALRNLRKSSLSREILFAGLFGVGWLSVTLESMVWHRNSFELTAMTVIFGIGLIHNMSQVYRFPAAPGWNSWRTNAGFMVSALLLGQSAMAPILACESRVTGIHVSSIQWMIIGASIFSLLLTQLVVMHKQKSQYPFQEMWIGLIFVGLALTAVSFVSPAPEMIWTSTFLFLIILAEEILGRWLFYSSRI